MKKQLPVLATIGAFARMMTFSPHAESAILTPAKTPQPTKDIADGKRGATGLKSTDPKAQIARSPADTGETLGGIVAQHVGAVEEETEHRTAIVGGALGKVKDTTAGFKDAIAS